MNKISETVLCYIERDNQYLMLYRNKKQNDLNEGKYIGIGGHIEQGETKEEALLREVKEETNLDLIQYQYCGEVIFKNLNGLEEYQEKMYVYQSREFKNTLKECDEGGLQWIDKNKILSLTLWEGDPYFLKKILNNELGFSIELIYENKKLIRCIEK